MIIVILLLWFPQLDLLKRNSLFYSIPSAIYTALYFHAKSRTHNSRAERSTLPSLYAPFEFTFPEHPTLRLNTYDERASLYLCRVYWRQFNGTGKLKVISVFMYLLASSITLAITTS